MENHIYIFGTRVLKDPGMYAYWYERVTDARRSRVDAFRRDRDRRLSLAAGALLVYALSRAGIPEEEIHSGVVYEENGKPCLAGREDLHFNLSHSGEYAVCAVSERPVGVDIEKTRHFSARLARYVFHPEEILYIEENDKGDAGFTRLWTMKESLMKYLGTGIRLSPKAIRLQLQDGTVPFSGRDRCNSCHEPVRAVTDGHQTRDLSFTGYAIDGYSLTVCSPCEHFADRVEWLDSSEWLGQVLDKT